MTDKVLVEEVRCHSKGKLCFITFNAPEKLNAQDTEMVRTIYSAISIAIKDKETVCIVLSSNSDKAFCAGGDVAKLYKVQCNENYLTSEVSDFFTKEYELIELIHQCQKPILAWANGITMGGGLGLINGASHRIVTERSLLAMPEITIGLIPDVGATRFLKQMPSNFGLFFALCAYKANPEEALYLGLADHLFLSVNRDDIFEQLERLDWQMHESDHLLLTELLEASEKKQSESALHKLKSIMQKSKNFTETNCLIELNTLLTKKDEMELNTYKENLNYGSKDTIDNIIKQFYINETPVDISQALSYELKVVKQCCLNGDFCEGVRALLIDKDRMPNWNKLNH